ncbi:MAG: 2-keto-4-pentenoate hydratase [Roseiflexaceae bacterium]
MNHTTVANALLLSRQNATLCPPPSENPAYTLADAYAVAKIHLDTARSGGMTPVGRKIGFTNPTAWASMLLNTPVWGYVYDKTVFDTTAGHTTHDLRGAMQPKIEPEIMFGLKATVPGTGDPVDALGAVAWIALGFEVVSCPYPDWKFKGVDAVSGFGLHRALYVGPKRILTADDDLVAIVAALGAVTARIYKNTVLAGEGSGKIVLGNPAKALAALGVICANQPQFAPLAAGEIISSGTLTPPPTIEAGDVIRAEVAGFDLSPVEVSF